MFLLIAMAVCIRVSSLVNVCVCCMSMYQAMAVWCRLAYRRYGNTVFGVILSHDKQFVLPRQARYKHKEK